MMPASIKGETLNEREREGAEKTRVARRGRSFTSGRGRDDIIAKEDQQAHPNQKRMRRLP